MKVALIITFLLTLASCSNRNLSKNMVVSGDITLAQGVFEEDTWDEDLEFNRSSWYHGMTLYFDVLTTKLEKDSPFRKWLSPSEKRLVNSCNDHLIVLSYQLDSRKISLRNFFVQAEKQGYDNYLIPQFARNVTLHPDYELLYLQLFKVHLLCTKGEKKDLRVTFPGYNTHLLNNKNR